MPCQFKYVFLILPRPRTIRNCKYSGVLILINNKLKLINWIEIVSTVGWLYILTLVKPMEMARCYVFSYAEDRLDFVGLAWSLCKKANNRVFR